MSEWVNKVEPTPATRGHAHPLAGAEERGLARPADPVAAILGEGPRDGFDWFYAGLAAAFAMHAAMLAFAIASAYLHEIHALMKATRVTLHEYFWTQYDVDLTPKDKPKEEPPKQEEPPPAPEAPPPPAPKAAPKLKDDPYDQPPPPPTPAKAAAVLTQKEDPDKVEDLTGNTVVTGDGTATFGQKSAAGTG